MRSTIVYKVFEETAHTTHEALICHNPIIERLCVTVNSFLSDNNVSRSDVVEIKFERKRDVQNTTYVCQLTCWVNAKEP